MRIVIISDTHCLHDQLVIPDCDLLIHAGDATNLGSQDEVSAFADWMGKVKLPAGRKLFVKGNHEDNGLAADDPDTFRLYLEGACTYLEDSGITSGTSGAAIASGAGDTVTVWGSPWLPGYKTPNGGGTEPQLAEYWSLIPKNTEILVTHGPAHGILDWVPQKNTVLFGRIPDPESVGSTSLRQRVMTEPPRLHVCGHVHYAYGTLTRGSTLFVNAALQNGPASLRAPIVVDRQTDGSYRVVSEDSSRFGARKK